MSALIQKINHLQYLVDTARQPAKKNALMRQAEELEYQLYLMLRK